MFLNSANKTTMFTFQQRIGLGDLKTKSKFVGYSITKRGKLVFVMKTNCMLKSEAKKCLVF